MKDGKIVAPIKNAALIGDGPSGKNGQGVPVGVGQPTIKIDRLTVGGAGG